MARANPAFGVCLGPSPPKTAGADIRLRAPGGEDISFFSPLPGEHNALNTVAACAALCAAGLSLSQASQAQAKFAGVRRRQEVRGQAGGVMVVDDFAHHPTAVYETGRALAAFGLPGRRPGAGRVVAVFEPRTNTSKRNFFQKQYAEAFDWADLIFLREPPGAEDVPPEERFFLPAPGRGFDKTRQKRPGLCRYGYASGRFAGQAENGRPFVL